MRQGWKVQSRGTAELLRGFCSLCLYRALPQEHLCPIWYYHRLLGRRHLSRLGIGAKIKSKSWADRVRINACFLSPVLQIKSNDQNRAKFQRGVQGLRCILQTVLGRASFSGSMPADGCLRIRLFPPGHTEAPASRLLNCKRQNLALSTF